MRIRDRDALESADVLRGDEELAPPAVRIRIDHAQSCRPARPHFLELLQPHGAKRAMQADRDVALGAAWVV